MNLFSIPCNFFVAIHASDGILLLSIDRQSSNKAGSGMRDETTENKMTTYQYAILRADGLYYNGNSYGDSRDWTSNPMDVFTYTEKGAYRKIDLFPYFAGCSVVRFH